MIWNREFISFPSFVSKGNLVLSQGKIGNLIESCTLENQKDLEGFGELHGSQILIRLVKLIIIILLSFSKCEFETY